MSKTDEMTIELKTGDFSSGPIPADEFYANERVKEAIKDVVTDAGAKRQLSFNLGVPLAPPDDATLKITGSLAVTRDLLYSEHVTIRVVDQYGVIVGEAPATLGYPTFKDHPTPAGGKTVERVHTAALD